MELGEIGPLQPEVPLASAPTPEHSSAGLQPSAPAQPAAAAAAKQPVASTSGRVHAQRQSSTALPVAGSSAGLRQPQQQPPQQQQQQAAAPVQPQQLQPKPEYRETPHNTAAANQQLSMQPQQQQRRELQLDWDYWQRQQAITGQGQVQQQLPWNNEQAFNWHHTPSDHYGPAAGERAGWEPHQHGYGSVRAEPGMPPPWLSPQPDNLGYGRFAEYQYRPQRGNTAAFPRGHGYL